MGISLVKLLLATCLAIVARAQTGYLTFDAGISPRGITATDLNGDGKPDLAIANSGSSSLSILLNTGESGFAPAAPVSLVSFVPNSMVAADLNADGKTDLVVVGTNSGLTTQSGGILILLGNGDGTFRAPVAVPNSSGAISVQVADLNGDGIPDLAAAYLTLGFLVPTGAGLAIFPGNGDGTFGAATGSFLGLTPWAVLAIADFNRDGTPDIAAVIGHGLTVFLNDGRANFTPVVSGGEPWNFAPAIAAGDLNGDGALDLAVTSQANNPSNGAVTVLLGNGDGTFRAAPGLETGSTAQNCSIADLNGDGFADLVIGSIPPVFFPGRGDGTFESGLLFGASGNTGYFAIAGFTGGPLMGLAATNYRLTSGSEQATGNAVILPQAVWPSLTLANVSAAGFGLGPVAPGSSVTALGSNLAIETAPASNGMPSASLGGDTVTVTGADGKSLPAELYYVSPQQVNYVIPPGVPPGLATVKIIAAGGVAATGQIDIEPVEPALFTVGAGNLAAAYITRVNQNGQQSFQPVYGIDSNGNYLPAPIDLTSATDTLYLSIFGTGIRNVGALSAVVATLGATANAQVTYAGPQGSYDGLDQVNILLPSGPNSALASPTPLSTTLQLTVAGQPSNQVTLTVE
jgi:uncharacterized protein (TIGR03437 family)